MIQSPSMLDDHSRHPNDHNSSIANTSSITTSITTNDQENPWPPSSSTTASTDSLSGTTATTTTTSSRKPLGQLLFGTRESRWNALRTVTTTLPDHGKPPLSTSITASTTTTAVNPVGSLSGTAVEAAIAPLASSVIATNTATATSTTNALRSHQSLPVPSSIPSKSRGRRLPSPDTRDDRPSFYESFQRAFPEFVRENAETTRRIQQLSHPDQSSSSAVTAAAQSPVRQRHAAMGHAQHSPVKRWNSTVANADAANLLIDRLNEKQRDYSQLQHRETLVEEQLQRVHETMQALFKKKQVLEEQRLRILDSAADLEEELHELAESIAYLDTQRRSHDRNGSFFSEQQHVPLESTATDTELTDSEDDESDDSEQDLLESDLDEGDLQLDLMRTIDRKTFSNADSCIKTLSGHTLPVTSVDFVDSHGALVTAGEDCTMRIWDLGRWRLLKTVYAHEGPVRCLQYTGTYVFSGGDDSVVKLWKIPDIATTSLSSFDQSGQDEWLDTSYRGHTGSVRCLQVERDTLISGSADNSVRVWDIEREECTKILSHFIDENQEDNGSTTGDESFSSVYSLSSAGVGALQFQRFSLATGGSDGVVRLWDLRMRNTAPVGKFSETQREPSPSRRSPPSRSSSTSPSIPMLPPTPVTILQNPTPTPPARAASPSRTSPSRSESTSPTPTAFSTAASTATATSTSTTSPDRHRRRRTKPAYERAFRGHRHSITTLQFDDHHLISGSLDQSIRVWDLRNATCIEGFQSSSPNGIQHLQFDRHKIIAAAGDKDIAIFDRRTHQQHLLQGHHAPVRFVKYRGNRLISGGDDSVVKLWDI